MSAAKVVADRTRTVTLALDLSDAEASTVAMAAARIGVPLTEFLRVAAAAQARDVLRRKADQDTSPSARSGPRAMPTAC